MTALIIDIDSVVREDNFEDSVRWLVSGASQVICIGVPPKKSGFPRKTQVVVPQNLAVYESPSCKAIHPDWMAAVEMAAQEASNSIATLRAEAGRLLVGVKLQVQSRKVHGLEVGIEITPDVSSKKLHQLGISATLKAMANVAAAQNFVLSESGGTIYAVPHSLSANAAIQHCVDYAKIDNVALWSNNEGLRKNLSSITTMHITT